MTERIQVNMERMIPELEDYKNRGIFSPCELRKIIDKRRKYEFRLLRPEKKLLDFVRYIKSECILERIRDKRLREKDVNTSLYDSNISNKIVELYKAALYRFREPKIISQFTAYAVEKKLYEEMKSIFAECCSRNPLDVDMWVYCAFKLFEVDDIGSARAMFLKGIRMNSKSFRVRINFFRMEVMYIEKMEALNREIGLDEDDKDDIERGELAFGVFLDYFDSYYLCRNELDKFLEISKKTHELHEKIKRHTEEYLQTDSL